jgi:hypothetical protein
MPYEIRFDKPPAGYALSGARGGEHALIQTFEFTSTEDGQHFILRLEGFPDEILQCLQPQRRIAPSEVDHLLALINSDGRTTVYVNELELVGTVRPNRPIAKGELLGKDDLVEVKALDVGVQIPPDVGFVLDAVTKV